MKKILVVLVAIAFVAGAAYAAEEALKASVEPVKTVADSTVATVGNAGQGVVDTLNIEKNNPVTTAVESTAKVAEDSVKTVTFQKVEKTSAKK